MSDLSYWRVYCQTEGAWVYGYASNVPTTCFTNAGHTITPDSEQEVQSSSQTFYGVATMPSTVDSTSLGVGAVVVANGGLSVAAKSHFGGVLKIINTTVSTSVGIGAFVCNGGVSVASNSYFGGSIFTSGILTLTNTATASSSSTGALILSGGLGTSGTVYIGNSLTTTGFTTLSGVTSITNTTTSSSTSTGSLVVSGGLGLAGNMYIGSSFNVSGTSTMSGVLNITNTTVSSSVSTGSLVIAGGVGISGTVYSNGAVRINNTSSTTSVASGALIVQGGIAAVGSIYTTGNIRCVHASSSSTITIDAKNSTSTPAQLLFANVGDCKIASATGDFQIFGGESRNLQIGAYNGIMLKGNSLNLATLSQVPGTTSYNTQILNTTNCIGLIVQGNGTQTTNLQEWRNSSGVVLSQVTPNGNLIVNATTESTSVSTGSIVSSGGLGVSGNTFIGGKISSVGGRSINMTTVTTTYTILASDHYLACDTSSASFTITLPSSTFETMYVISKVSTDANSLTIAAQNGEIIGGSSSLYVMTLGYSFVCLVGTGTAWNIMSTSEPVTGSFPYAYGTLYGNGSFGSVTIAGNTSLTQNSYYTNLTINSDVTLNPNGWLICVSNTLTFVSGTSTIACNGNNASSNTAGSGASTYCDLINGTYSTYLGGGTNGANGRTSSGNGASGVSYTTNNYSAAGQGGSGGNTTNNGGNAGVMNAITTRDGGVGIIDVYPNCMGRGMLSFYYIAFNGGTGGGAGAATGGLGLGLASGGGGGGGGVIGICAKNIVAPSGGIIQAKGGNGGNATASTLNNASLAGGGGGGGGIISIITGTPFTSLSLTTSVAGGNGGTALGTNGNPGNAGSPGRIIINQI